MGMGTGNVGGPTYFAGSRAFSDRGLLRPRDGVCAVAIVEEAGASWPTAGIAYPVGWTAADEEAGRPAEVLWRLVVGKAEVPGRYVLRTARFVEAGESK